MDIDIEIKGMQIPGTEEIRTYIQPLKPKREITKITKSQKTKRTYGQSSERLFLKGGHSATQPEHMNTPKAKRHRNFKAKNRQQRTTTKLPPKKVSNELLGGGGVKLVLRAVAPNRLFCQSVATTSK